MGNRDGNIDLLANSLRKSCFIYLNMVGISPMPHLHYTAISSLLLATMSRSTAAGLGVMVSSSVVLHRGLGCPNSHRRSGTLESHDGWLVRMSIPPESLEVLLSLAGRSCHAAEGA